MNRKAILIALVASLLLAFSVIMGVKAHFDNKEKVLIVLSIKKSAFQLHRNILQLDKAVAKEEVTKLENRMLNAEATLSPGDEQCQHWLDQSYELILDIHKKLEDKKVEPDGNSLYRSFPGYLY